MAKNRKGKKYTAEEKFRYHKSRVFSCGKYGIEFGGSAHSYSGGFIDAFNELDNRSAMTATYGKKVGRAYALGYKRGTKAAREYFDTTGKQPSDLKYEREK